MKRRANKACGKGQLRVKRKGYKRSDGTRLVPNRIFDTNEETEKT